MSPSLWAAISAMVALTGAGLTIPLVRRYDAAAQDHDAVVTVLRDQLAEIDAQAASGQVAAAEAPALRLELKRRLLVEHRARPVAARLLTDRVAARLALALAAVVALAATGIYAITGRPDLTAPVPARVVNGEAAAAVAPPAAGDGGSESAVLGDLEARTRRTPGEADAWRMLGWGYFQAQRFADAATAYARAATLQPRDASLVSAQGEALTQGSGGVVSPAARAAFDRAHALDAADPRARYFLALARDQQGDHRGAIDDWVRLLRDAPPGAPWVPEMRRFVDKAARDAGIDLAGRLPAAGGDGSAMPGPDAATVQAATAMTPDAQQTFIRSMVDRLDARLAANPRDRDGWIRLIRARTVLGDLPGARTALSRARAAFADDPSAAKAISDSAAALGVG